MPRVVDGNDFVADFDIIPQIVEAAMEGPRRAARAVMAFAMAAEREIEHVGPRLLAAHSQVAREAQSAVLEAYEGARAGSERHSGPYRVDAMRAQNRRFAGGVLAEALAAPEFAVATEEGILFADRSFLNARARQWHRLNFGAGRGGEPRMFQVTWGGMAAFSIGLEGEEPSPSFRLPAGYWVEPGGEFYPESEIEEVPDMRLRRSTRQAIHTEGGPTRGIRPEEWLDAGVRRMAELLPPAYDGVYRELFEDAQQQGRETVSGTVTKYVRPTARGLGARTREI